MSAFGNPMSWISSLFSSKSSATTTNTTPLLNEKRLLDEEPPKLAGSTTAPVAQPQQPARSAQPLQDINPNRNKVIFGAGIAFFAFSLLITRRSFARKRLATAPAFYTDTVANHARQAAKVSGAMEALEALNIATINVLSVSMMATGGALWYMDINSMADARRLLRGGLGVDGTGRDETQAEEEFEEWMATVLSRRDAKEKARDDNSTSNRVNERGKER